MPRTKERVNKINKVVQNRQKGAVVLEDITDPHNASAVFRSCDAFGIQDVYLIFDKQPVFDPKKIGKLSSSSANRWLDFHVFDSIDSCYKELKEKGFTTIATTLDERSDDIYRTDFVEDENIALIFGNEHSGLSQQAIEKADKKMYIPMNGMVQSLNISVTAAICLFEMSRQRLYSTISGGKPFSFSSQDQEELTKSLLTR